MASRQASKPPFATAQAGDPEVWFGPYPAGFSNGGMNPSFGATDYMSLFQEDAPWTQARDRVDVFQFYFAWLMEAPPADIATAVSFLQAHEIAIAIEASPLRAQDTALGDPETCGMGSESWIEDPVGWTLEALQAVDDAGGSVHAVIGKRSFPPEDLAANLTAFIDYLRTLRSPQVKGNFIAKVTVSSTMGPGIPLSIR